jgi:hypothetical protein
VSDGPALVRFCGSFYDVQTIADADEARAEIDAAMKEERE